MELGKEAQGGDASGGKFNSTGRKDVKEDSVASLFLDSLTSLTALAAGVCVVGIIGFTGVEILGRWLFGFTTRGSEELTAFMMVGVTYLGLGHAFLKGGHINVDFLIARCSPRVQSMLHIGYGIIGTVFCALIVYYSSKLVSQNIAFGSRSLSSWEVPMAIPAILVPIGAGNLGLLMLAHTVRLFRIFLGSKEVKTNARGEAL